MMFVFVCIAGLLLIPVLLLTLRAVYLIFKIFTTEQKYEQASSYRTILCIGSGGHTAELLRIRRNLNPDKYQPRLYLLADTDVSSEVKIYESEAGSKNYSLSKIPRSRQVNQSYFSSIFTSIYAILYTIPLVFKFKPTVILCNGPGTCIPICVVGFIMRCLFILDCRIVFIESICRVRTLSLTGNILQYIADIFVVQWPQLRDVCYRAKYFGRLT